jgi:adenine/guanine phosphoribosyltransferase-like PRPP-binding protein
MVGAARDDIVKDLSLLVNPGLDDAAGRLRCLPELAATAARLRSSNDSGLRAAIRRLVGDALDEIRASSPEYARAARALLVLGPRTRTAEARLAAAGQELDKSAATFKRHHERRVLYAVADAVLMIDAETAGPAAAGSKIIDVGWQAIQSTLHTLHREIGSAFEPDVVVTMSGPGSFAAFLCLAMDPRDVPIVACTTFPRRDRPSHTHRVFEMAARGATWQVIATSKWVVYLPLHLSEFPQRSRMLLFDDRVVSGDTQREVRALLESAGFEVRSAAMIVSSASAGLVDFHGVVIDEDYALPWGSRRGRT